MPHDIDKLSAAGVQAEQRRRRPLFGGGPVAAGIEEAREVGGRIVDGLDSLVREVRAVPEQLAELPPIAGGAPTARRWLRAESAGVSFPKLSFGNESPSEGSIWLIEQIFVTLTYTAAPNEFRIVTAYLSPNTPQSGVAWAATRIATIRTEALQSATSDVTAGSENFGTPLIWRPGEKLYLYDNIAGTAARCEGSVQISERPG